MIRIACPEHFAETLEFAASVGAFKAFMKRVEYLTTYGDGLNTVELHKDWAPHSFEFLMLRPDGTRWFNGGLIYQGPGQPGDGSAPALTVSLCSDPAVHKWGVHT